jgi:hypothetical protein
MSVSARPAPGRLRVGLLVDSLVVPAWVARVVDDIQRSDVAEVALVVVNQAPRPRRSLRRLVAERGRLLHKAYMALDARLFRVPQNPFRRRDLAPALAGVPALPVTPEQTRHSDYFPADAVQAIRDARLDVAFRFGFRILRGDVLKAARHGVWSFHHGDNLVNRGSPPGFWEVVEREPVTGSILQVLTSDLDAGRVLYRSWSSTHPYSVLRNRARMYNKTAAFAIRALRELHRTGRPPLADADRGCAYRPYTHPLYKNPGNGAMLSALARLAARGARAAVHNALYRGSWMLAYKVSEPGRLPERLYDFTPLRPPKDRFWADPFPIVRDGRRVIFFEEWVRGAPRAHISALEIRADGTPGAPVRVLERPYHLSYPFVFEWDGALYMIPETKGNRTVELYRCARFPDEWRLERVLLADVEAVDATVHEVDGRWWMFLSMAEPGASLLDELHLYHADSPLGPWRPHARNPVKSDVRSARPAGRLFVHGDALMRPAQDGSVRYGYAVTLNRVTCLTPDEYGEEAVSRILPRWRAGVHGTHTFNHHGGLTVIDGFWYRRRVG